MAAAVTIGVGYAEAPPLPWVEDRPKSWPGEKEDRRADGEGGEGGDSSELIAVAGGLKVRMRRGDRESGSELLVEAAVKGLNAIKGSIRRKVSGQYIAEGYLNMSKCPDGCERGGRRRIMGEDVTKGRDMYTADFSLRLSNAGNFLRAVPSADNSMKDTSIAIPFPTRKEQPEGPPVIPAALSSPLHHRLPVARPLPLLVSLSCPCSMWC